MAIIRIKEQHLKPAVFGTTGLFLCLAVLYFLPVDIPHKISFPLATLFVAGLWLLPWQMWLAMGLSAAGDYFGSCGNFLGQMGFFALAHISMIAFFIGRYFRKVENDGRLSARAKGYLAIVFLCVSVEVAFAICRIAPGAPEGIVRIGVRIYALVIGAMLLLALLQRSSLYALGGVLFVFSDFILAWNLFVEPIPGENYLIMIPYYLGQWLLWVRSSPFRTKTQIRLMRF